MSNDYNFLQAENIKEATALILCTSMFIIILVFYFSANLSQSYFTDRQDRYLQFCQCPDMASYFTDIIQTISEFSFHLQCNNETNYPENTPHPYIGNVYTFKSQPQYFEPSYFCRMDQIVGAVFIILIKCSQ